MAYATLRVNILCITNKMKCFTCNCGCVVWVAKHLKVDLLALIQ